MVAFRKLESKVDFKKSDSLLSSIMNIWRKQFIYPHLREDIMRRYHATSSASLIQIPMTWSTWVPTSTRSYDHGWSFLSSVFEAVQGRFKLSKGIWRKKLCSCQMFLCGILMHTMALVSVLLHGQATIFCYHPSYVVNIWSVKSDVWLVVHKVLYRAN